MLRQFLGGTGLDLQQYEPTPGRASLVARIGGSDLDPTEYGKRFHGHDERIDVESLRLTTQLWLDVARDLLA